MWLYCTEKKIHFLLFEGTLNKIIHRGNVTNLICEDDNAFFIVDEHAFLTKERLDNVWQKETLAISGNFTEHNASGWVIPTKTPLVYYNETVPSDDVMQSRKRKEERKRE